MLENRPNKSATIFVALGLLLLIACVLAVILLVRRQPITPRITPGATGAQILRTAAPARQSRKVGSE